MATAQARQVHVATGQRVVFCKQDGRPVWSPVFENNPRISAKRGPGLRVLFNCGGSRPYIKAKTPERWEWQKWNIEPGEIYLTGEETAFAEPYRGGVLIEPNTKIDGGNKAWPWDRWQSVADSFAGIFVQTGGNSCGRQLVGVRYCETTFRQACAVLSVCKAFVGTEGGLHHAAAAFGVPSVVLFSEFISPAITGYESHRNLRHAGEACGSRLPCIGCKASMDAISVDEVVTNLKEILQ